MPDIEAAGAKFVVVTPQSSARASAWREQLSLERAIVIADPKLTLYRALGARRPLPFWVLRPRVVLAGVKAIFGHEKVGFVRGDDTFQLGADVVIDSEGRIAFLHLAKDAADRVPPAELIAVVRGLESEPPAGDEGRLQAAG